jgi:PAS domain-containing protein
VEDTYWTFIYAPLQDENGKVDRVVAICNEVTEHVRARTQLERLAAEATAELRERQRVEAAFREREQRYRRLFDTAGVSLWEEDFSAVKACIEQLKAQGVTDFQHFFATHPEVVDQAIGLVHIVDVNAETVRMFGARGKDDLLGSLHRIFVPETRQVFVGELLTMAAGQTFYEAETILQTLQGARIHVLSLRPSHPAWGQAWASRCVRASLRATAAPSASAVRLARGLRFGLSCRSAWPQISPLVPTTGTRPQRPSPAARFCWWMMTRALSRG